MTKKMTRTAGSRIANIIRNQDKDVANGDAGAAANREGFIKALRSVYGDRQVDIVLFNIYR